MLYDFINLISLKKKKTIKNFHFNRNSKCTKKNTKQNVFEIENNNKSPEKVQRLNKTEIYFFPGRDYVLNRRGSGIRSDYCY